MENLVEIRFNLGACSHQSLMATVHRLEGLNLMATETLTTGWDKGYYIVVKLPVNRVGPLTDELLREGYFD